MNTNIPPRTINYSEILGQTFTLFLRHRSLWLAGIFSVLLGGGYSFNFGTNFQANIPMPTPTQPGQLPDIRAMLEGTWIGEFIANPMPYLLAGVVIIVLLTIIRLVFGTWAEAALIAMTDEADRTGHTSLAGGWGRMRGHLGALIGANLLLTLPVLLLMGLVFLLFFPAWLDLMRILMRMLMLAPEEMEQAVLTTFPPMMASFFFAIPLICCLGFPVMILTALLRVYALRGCALAGLGAVASIKASWSLLRAQWGYTLLNGIIVLVVGAVSSAILMLPVMVVWMQVAPGLLRGGLNTEMFRQLAILLVVMYLAGVVIGGVVAGFTSSLWTKLYKAIVVPSVN